MNVVAYSALLYGKDYLGCAIRSIIEHVDEYFVLYSPIGAHGHRTSVPCPETEDELYAIASAAAGAKLRWHHGEWPYEGAQRDTIHQLAPDADVILVVDSDELWPDGLVQRVLDYAGSVTNSIPPFRTLRLPMIHMWRSFYRAVLHDPAFPVRIIFPRIPEKYGEQTWAGQRPIVHFGYAQRSEIVEYKLLTHGHRGEFRRDVDWWQERWLANAQEDCHPVGSQYWNPEPVNPLDYLPAWMAEHPYYSLEVIP